MKLSHDAQLLLAELKLEPSRQTWSTKMTFEQFKNAAKELIAAKLAYHTKFGYMKAR